MQEQFTKLAYSIPQAAAASAISRTQLYRIVRRGDLALRKSGKRSFILAADLKRFLESLPTANEAKAA